jgi:hypothetical protein
MPSPISEREEIQFKNADRAVETRASAGARWLRGVLELLQFPHRLDELIRRSETCR